MAFIEPLLAVSTSTATVGTWGSERFDLRREAKWGFRSAKASRAWPSSGGSASVLAERRPEGASCDFAKMVFTDPS